MKSLVIGSKINGKWDADRMAQALLLFRNAPRCDGGASPAETVFGHPIRDTLPAHSRSFTKQWQRPEEELKERTEAARERSAAFYNRTAHPLTDLSIGDHVLIQDPINGQWLDAGEVIEAGPNRDYLIRTTNGKVFRRNRRHLLRRVPVLPTPPMPAIELQQKEPSTYAEAAGGSSNATVPAAEQRPAATPPPVVQQPVIPIGPVNNTAPPARQHRRARSPTPTAPTRRSNRSRPNPATTTQTIPHQSGPNRRSRQDDKKKKARRRRN